MSVNRVPKPTTRRTVALPSEKRTSRIDPRVIYAHPYDEPFEPSHACGTRVVIKSTDLTLIKDEIARTMNTGTPVRFISTPTGIPITDVSSLANHSHVFVWTKNIRPRHAPPGGVRLIQHLKQIESNSNNSSLPSSASSSPTQFHQNHNSHPNGSSPPPMANPAANTTTTINHHHHHHQLQQPADAAETRRASLSEIFKRFQNVGGTGGTAAVGGSRVVPTGEHADSPPVENDATSPGTSVLGGMAFKRGVPPRLSKRTQPPKRPEHTLPTLKAMLNQPRTRGNRPGSEDSTHTPSPPRPATVSMLSPRHHQPLHHPPFPMQPSHITNVTNHNTTTTTNSTSPVSPRTAQGVSITPPASPRANELNAKPSRQATVAPPIANGALSPPVQNAQPFHPQFPPFGHGSDGSGSESAGSPQHTYDTHSDDQNVVAISIHEGHPSPHRHHPLPLHINDLVPLSSPREDMVTFEDSAPHVQLPSQQSQSHQPQLNQQHSGDNYDSDSHGSNRDNDSNHDSNLDVDVDVDVDVDADDGCHVGEDVDHDSDSNSNPFDAHQEGTVGVGGLQALLQSRNNISSSFQRDGFNVQISDDDELVSTTIVNAVSGPITVESLDSEVPQPILKSRRGSNKNTQLKPATHNEHVSFVVVHDVSSIPPGQYSAPNSLTLPTGTPMPGDELASHAQQLDDSVDMDNHQWQRSNEMEGDQGDGHGSAGDGHRRDNGFDDEEEVAMLVQPGPFPNEPGAVEGRLIRWWDMDYDDRPARVRFAPRFHLRPEEIPPGHYNPASVGARQAQVEHVMGLFPNMPQFSSNVSTLFGSSVENTPTVAPPAPPSSNTAPISAIPRLAIDPITQPQATKQQHAPASRIPQLSPTTSPAQSPRAANHAAAQDKAENEFPMVAKAEVEDSDDGCDNDDESQLPVPPSDDFVHRDEIQLYIQQAIEKGLASGMFVWGPNFPGGTPRTTQENDNDTRDHHQTTNANANTNNKNTATPNSNPQDNVFTFVGTDANFVHQSAQISVVELDSTVVSARGGESFVYEQAQAEFTPCVVEEPPVAAVEEFDDKQSQQATFYASMHTNSDNPPATPTKRSDARQGAPSTPSKDRVKLSWFVIQQIHSVLENHVNYLPEEVASWVTRIEAIMEAEPNSDSESSDNESHGGGTSDDASPRLAGSRTAKVKQMRRLLTQADKESQSLRTKLAVAERAVEEAKDLKLEFTDTTERAVKEAETARRALHEHVTATREQIREMTRERDALAARVKRAEAELTKAQKEFDVKTRFRDRRLERSKRMGEVRDAVGAALTKTQAREKGLRRALSAVVSLVRVERNSETLHQRLMQWCEKHASDVVGNEASGQEPVVDASLAAHGHAVAECLALVDKGVDGINASERLSQQSLDSPDGQALMQRELERLHMELDSHQRVMGSLLAHVDSLHTTNEALSARVDVLRAGQRAGSVPEELRILRQQTAVLEASVRGNLRRAIERSLALAVNMETRTGLKLQALESRLVSCVSDLQHTKQGIQSKSSKAFANSKLALESEASHVNDLRVQAAEAARDEAVRHLNIARDKAREDVVTAQQKARELEEKVARQETVLASEREAIQRKWKKWAENMLEDQQRAHAAEKSALAQRETELRGLVLQVEGTLAEATRDRDSLVQAHQKGCTDMARLTQRNADLERQIKQSNADLSHERSQGTKQMEDATHEALSTRNLLASLQEQIKQLEAENKTLRACGAPPPQANPSTPVVFVSSPTQSHTLLGRSTPTTEPSSPPLTASPTASLPATPPHVSFVGPEADDNDHIRIHNENSDNGRHPSPHDFEHENNLIDHDIDSNHNGDDSHHNVDNIHHNVDDSHHNVDNIHHNVDNIHHNVDDIHHNVDDSHHNVDDSHHNDIHHNVIDSHHNVDDSHHNVDDGHHNVDNYFGGSYHNFDGSHHDNETAQHPAYKQPQSQPHTPTSSGIPVITTTPPTPTTPSTSRPPSPPLVVMSQQSPSPLPTITEVPETSHADQESSFAPPSPPATEQIAATTTNLPFPHPPRSHSAGNMADDLFLFSQRIPSITSSSAPTSPRRARERRLSVPDLVITPPEELARCNADDVSPSKHRRVVSAPEMAGIGKVALQLGNPSSSDAMEGPSTSAMSEGANCDSSLPRESSGMLATAESLPVRDYLVPPVDNFGVEDDDEDYDNDSDDQDAAHGLNNYILSSNGDTNDHTGAQNEPSVWDLVDSAMQESNVVVDKSLRDQLAALERSTNLGHARFVIIDCGRTRTSVFVCTLKNHQQQIIEEFPRHIASLATYVDNQVAIQAERFLFEVVNAMQPSHVIFGLPVWFAKAPQKTQEQVRGMLARILTAQYPADTKSHGEILELSKREQSVFEALAAQYAADMTGLGHLDLHLATHDGLVSVVVTCDEEPNGSGEPGGRMMHNFTVDVGFDEGQDLLSEQGPLAEPEVRKMWAQAVKPFVARIPESIRLCIATGTFHHLACNVLGLISCGEDSNGTNDLQPAAIQCSALVDEFERAAKEILARYPTTPTSVLTPHDAAMVSHLVGHACILDHVVPPNAVIHLRDGWKIRGRNFTSSWPVGWFMIRQDDMVLESIPSTSQKFSASQVRETNGVELGASCAMADAYFDSYHQSSQNDFETGDPSRPI